MALKPSVTVKTVTNRIPLFLHSMDDAVQKGVDATAYAVQGTAQRMAVYRTGTMRRSIHVITPTTSGYERALPKAGQDVEIVSEAPRPAKHTALVGVAVLYGKFVEFGTRYMGARPYLIPAFELEGKKLPERIRDFASRLR